jgi:hypothetical protein
MDLLLGLLRAGLALRAGGLRLCVFVYVCMRVRVHTRACTCMKQF